MLRLMGQYLPLRLLLAVKLEIVAKLIADSEVGTGSTTCTCGDIVPFCLTSTTKNLVLHVGMVTKTERVNMSLIYTLL